MNNEFKNQALQIIDSLKNEMIETSNKIYSFRELSLEEFKSSQLLISKLEENGFSIEKEVGGLKTAFIASKGTGKPAIALLAEYDALPKIGHACGHNLIGTSSTYAAIALGKLNLLEKFKGKILVIGTPGEEAFGGKIKMIRKGVFKGVDIALMIHPSKETRLIYKTAAYQAFKIDFFCQPERYFPGIRKPTIIDVLIKTFLEVDKIKKKYPKDDIFGVIPKGGKISNLIPSHLVADFSIWSTSIEKLKKIIENIKKAAQKSSLGSGVKINFNFYEPIYKPMKPNLKLARVFLKNLKFLKIPAKIKMKFDFDSIDMGNLSQIIPSLHPDLKMINIREHTKEFAKAARAKEGQEFLIKATKALSLTLIDLFSQPKIIAKIKEEFGVDKIKIK